MRLSRIFHFNGDNLMGFIKLILSSLQNYNSTPTIFFSLNLYKKKVSSFFNLKKNYFTKKNKNKLFHVHRMPIFGRSTSRPNFAILLAHAVLKEPEKRTEKRENVRRKKSRNRKQFFSFLVYLTSFFLFSF